jgi:gliding motility-associated lipoprotein GldH
MIKPSHILILTLLLLSACTQPSQVNQMHRFSGDTWESGEWVSFDFRIDDTLKSYDFFIHLRHSTAYPFQNLYLFADSRFPSGASHRDTLEFILAAPDGRWLGKGFGGYKYNDILIRKNIVFPDVGQYRFRFVQAMRTDTLNGLRDLGIRIRKSENGT